MQECVMAVVSILFSFTKFRSFIKKSQLQNKEICFQNVMI